MTASSRQLRTCPKGHMYYKSSDCPACPICEAEKRPDEGLLATLSAPARRTLESLGIKTATDLSRYSKRDILALHGMGPASLPKLEAALKAAGLKFREK